MLGEVRWEKSQRGICGVAGGGLEERKDVVERAARGLSEEGVEDRGSLRDRRNEGCSAMLHCRAKAGAAQFDGKKGLSLGGLGERPTNDAREA